MHVVKALPLLTLLLTLCVACSPNDTESTYSTPTQPDDAELGGKADEINKDVRKEAVSEALRSSTLRRMVCAAVLTEKSSRPLDEKCLDQTFEVTAYYTNLELSYRGEPMLVGMDVTVSTSDNGVYATQLVRDIKSSTFTMSWRAEYLSEIKRADDSALENAIKEGGASPEYSYSDYFVEISYDELPAKARFHAEEGIDAIEEGLAEDYQDDYFTERSKTYKIIDENGVTVGWAVSYSLSYGNGDGGVTFYMDAEGNYVDEERYYA